MYLLFAHVICYCVWELRTAAHSEGLRLLTLFTATILMYSFFPYSYFQTTMAESDQLSQELIGACKRGEPGTVQELLSRGADPSYREWRTKMTPLHYASRYVYVCAQLI